MTADRQTYSIDQIKDLLLADIDRVAHHFAPPVQGSWYDKGGYWTCNPGRIDRSPGSFVIWLSGPRAGRWNDYATGQRGDLVDLIALSLNCDLKHAFAQARQWLGLSTDTPELRRKRQKAGAEAKARRQEAERRQREDDERIRRGAVALWMSAQEKLRGTPAELYLRDRRGIDLAQLGHQPGSLRFHPDVSYQHIDPETGEVVEGRFPALLGLMSNGHGKTVAVHRVWLAIGPDGRWDKAPVPAPRKALGRYGGGCIRLWRGLTPGPRGGRPAPLSKCPPGTRVYITEGIEDALSGVLLLPAERWLCAVSLGNMGDVHLPENVSEVVLAADLDTNPDARKALDRVISKHQRAGRTVRLWQNRDGGKDLNDALLARQEKGKGAA